MIHRVYAETMAEAKAIISHLENWCDNYTGSIYSPTLMVTWHDEDFGKCDWLKIFEATLASLDGTPEYEEFSDVYEEEIEYCKGGNVHIMMTMYGI